MRLRSAILPGILALGLLVTSLTVFSRPVAAARSSITPDWLEAHVGDGEGQISQPVLDRARALYLKKVADGKVKNPCYFAMDATRPADLGDGNLGRRFYVVCEAEHSFRAMSSGHGSGRNLKGIVNFSNGRECAANFGNAVDSELTAGGAYLTSETKTSFKGYYRNGAKQPAAFLRSFVQFDGEGEAATARKRVIGGHPAVLLSAMCMRKDAQSPYANSDGYVPFGKLIDYAGGRSNGCTSWSAPDARQIIAMLKNDPTTLYIYPESKDIAAVAKASAAGQSPSSVGSYWNASCLKKIGSPKFWSRKTLEPVLEKYAEDNPRKPAKPLPICTEP